MAELAGAIDLDPVAEPLYQKLIPLLVSRKPACRGCRLLRQMPNGAGTLGRSLCLRGSSKSSLKLSAHGNT